PGGRAPSSMRRLPVAVLLKGNVSWELPLDDLRTRPALTNWDPAGPPTRALPWMSRGAAARLVRVTLFSGVPRTGGARVVPPPVSTTVPVIVTRPPKLAAPL